MPEGDDGRAPSESLEALLAEWRSAIAGVSPDETERARELIESELASAQAGDAFAGLWWELVGLATAGDDVARRLRSLLHAFEALEREWVAARRWEEVGLAALRQELEALVAERPADGARRWLNEVIDAFRAGEWNALERIAHWEPSFPPELEQGAAEVRSAHARWMEGDASAALELWRKVALCELPGWADTLDVPLRCRAHRVASWIALRHLHDLERAREQLDLAVELDPYAAPNFAERAAFLLSVNDLDDAAADAQRAVELAPQDPAGYLQLGTWAEQSGQFEDARELFRQALARMSADAIANVSTRATLLDAPGSLLVAAAQTLLAAGRPADALEAADAALVAGVRGVQA
ncbi:MAG: hypothetical protein ACRDNG_00175, partial [Gaiellaceae bacterium]